MSDDVTDPGPDAAAGPVAVPDPAPVPRSRLLVLAGAVTVVGLLGVWLSVVTGRLDSALLFVGVPCLMAFLVGALRSAGGWATLFQVITVVLLLSSALLREGALCVLLAAPLVYGFAALVHLAMRGNDPRQRYAALPLLVLVAAEGALPALRVHPDQQAEASRVVAADCATFEAALARGPRVDQAADRGRLLELAEYPTPVAITGSGLAPGDRWTLQMPAGRITTSVSERASGRIDFTVVADTAQTTRWVELYGGRLTWQQEQEGCRATVGIDYRRDLDPGFWFGPVTDVFMDAGAATLLASLD